MDFHGGGSGGLVVSSNNVPAFLTKLWTLVEDPETDPRICWSPSGSSFHVFDHARFSKEVLPKYFKHNNMASFIRQLNMYGFRKVVHIEHGGLLKPEQDDTEFQHPFFIRGQEHLLENIKRKVTAVSTVKQEEMKMSPDEVSKILNDMQLMKGKQENMDSKITAMKHENEALWREVSSLRQKHTQQQKVVNKLIQFLVSLVQSNRVLGMKRKIPLMINDSSSAHSMPKYSRQYSLEHLQSSKPAISAPSGVFSDGPVKSGPIISDITELSCDWIDARDSPVVLKEEPSSPELKEVCPTIPVDTPLSPTTFINSILQDHETGPAHNPAPDNSQSAANPRMEPGPSTASHTNNQSQPSTPAPGHTLCPLPPGERCLSVACLDKSGPYCRTELSEHLEDIDSSLENLHHLLSGPTINLDSSPLFEFFSPSGSSSGDFDLDSLDTLLSPEHTKEHTKDMDTSCSAAGKQLVQYTTIPMLMSEDGDLDSYFSTDDPEDDSTISLLTPAQPRQPKLS